MRLILEMHKIGYLRLVENSLIKLFVGGRVQTDVAQSVRLLNHGVMGSTPYIPRWHLVNLEISME